MKKIYFFSLILILSSTLLAQPGSLDQSFGQDGKLLITTSKNPSPVYSVIVKANGHILAGTGDANNFIIKQLLSDGTPDSSFADDGEIKTYFNKYSGALLYSIGTADNNKIVAAGYGFGLSGSHFSDILLAKYLENGEADMSFGDSGKVVADFNLIEYINCIKVLKSGKILVAGFCSANIQSQENFFIAQFNTDGSADTSFGDKGKTVTDVGHFYQSYINSIAINPDGSIIAAGRATSFSSSANTQFVLAKYSAGGKIDSEFGTNGLVFTNIGADAEYANAVVIQDDGKIVAAGLSSIGVQGPQGMAIVRYDANGTIDKSFNKIGSLTIFYGEDNAIANSIIIQADGKFLLGGIKLPKVSSSQDYKAYDFALASVTKEGRIDSLFGINGVVTTDFSALQDNCYALALQPDGKIIAAGGSTNVPADATYIHFCAL